MLYRELGNKKYGLGDSEAALALYSRAVLTAAPGQPELGLALANRSAALLSLNNHRAALQDIEVALSEGYPQVTNTTDRTELYICTLVQHCQDLAYKCHERAAKCYLEIGEIERARESIQVGWLVCSCKFTCLMFNLSRNVFNL